MKLLFPFPNPGTPGNKEWSLEILPQGGQHHPPGPHTVGGGLCVQLFVGRKALFHLFHLDDPKAARAAGPQTVTPWCSLVPCLALAPNLLINCDLLL